jgi:putative transcriptional regulator
MAGRLLVASPELTADQFRRTVILLLDHDSEGSLGVVVNRPTRLPVGEVLPRWGDHVAAPQVVFQGGPVSKDSALGLARLHTSGEAVGWRRLHENLGLIDLDAPPDLLAPGLRALRVFAGYAGWKPGQLAAEISSGAWFCVDSVPSDAFSRTPTNLWRAVLRRQSGSLALASTYPDDPTAN